jgi:hypothetical protein
LAESKNHFKIRNGDVEIEYEGPLTEVNKRFDKAYEWATNSPPKATHKEKIEKEEQSEDTDAKKEKKDKRGGIRKPIFAPTIQRLIEEGFFKEKRSVDDVIKKFEEKGLPVRGKKNAILTSLRYETSKRDSKLKSTKTENDWYFWVD